jgi:hypothetical protein
LTASQKVHLRRCTSSFIIAAYFYVLLIPHDSRALHLKLFTVPSTLATSYEVIMVRSSWKAVAELMAIVHENPARCGTGERGDRESFIVACKRIGD